MKWLNPFFSVVSILAAVGWTILFGAGIVIGQMLGGSGDGGRPIPVPQVKEYVYSALNWTVPMTAFILMFLISTGRIHGKAKVAGFWFALATLAFMTSIPMIFFPRDIKWMGLLFLPFAILWGMTRFRKAA